MLKNPQDRRAKRTAMQIKETTLSLMESKAIHEIRVSEICKVCQINRATFYDHYRDVFDLVQDMEMDILLALQELMETVSPEAMPPERVSGLFFAFLAEHRRNMRLLINSERSREFCIRLDAVIMPFFEKKIRQTYVIPEGMEAQLHCAMQFVAAGYYRFFMLALSEDAREISADGALCVRLSNACLDLLFAQKQKTAAGTDGSAWDIPGL